MYNQIKKMMDAYHTFASYPSFADIQTLMPAVEKGKVLLPMASKLRKLTTRNIVRTLNDQWLNMSNTSRKSISLNVQPRIGHGLKFSDGASKDVFPDDCIVVDGAELLLADYLVYSGDKSAQNVYFSVSDNEFMETSYSSKDTIPAVKLLGRDRKLDFKSHVSAKSSLEARFHDSELNRILNEIREKWQTYVYPLNICRGLTSWQEDGWSSVLKGDK